MDILIQTALILGFVALGLLGVSSMRIQSGPIARSFAGLCFAIAAWAFSFVAYERWALDFFFSAHWVAHVALAPFGVSLLNHLGRCQDLTSRILFRIAMGGALLLASMILFPWGQETVFFWIVVTLWPTWIFFTLIFHAVTLQKISSRQRSIYILLVFVLGLCSWDHFPALGRIIPSLGNVLLSALLIMLYPVFLHGFGLKLEAWATRIFAIMVLSFILSGVYVLLARSLTWSQSLPLLFLNTFLTAFVVIALWPGLLALGSRLVGVMRSRQALFGPDYLNAYREQLATVIDVQSLDQFIQKTLSPILEGFEVRLVEWVQKTPDLGVFQSKLWFYHQDPIPDFLRTQMDQFSAEVMIPLRDEHKVYALILIVRPTGPGWEILPLRFVERFSTLVPDMTQAWVRALKTQNRELQKKLAFLGELSASLAHEIRTPLGAILGAVDLIEGNERWTQMIKHEVQRLDRLVTHVLDLSKESVDLNATTPLREVVGEVVQRFETKHPMRKGMIRFSPDLPDILVKMAPDAFSQVVWIVFENANTATRYRDFPEVTVSWEVNLPEVKIVVRDNGVGVQDVESEQFFKPFFSRFEGGSGLGLSVAERSVRAYGGKIKLLPREDALPGAQVSIEIRGVW